MITYLTKENEIMIQKYVDKYTKIGFNTADFEISCIEEDIQNFYKVILEIENKPEVKIFDSPFALWKYVQSFMGNIPFVFTSIEGNFSSHVFAFYDYTLNELGVEVDKDLLKKYNIWRKTMNMGPIYCFDDVCLVSKHPETINLNEVHELHCEDGPAIRYRDGFEVYSLNGVRIKKEYVMNPVKEFDVMKETNAEIRRELIRKIGIEKLAEKLGFEVLDAEDDYQLINIDLGDDRIRPFLKMKNPSIKTWHIEGVPPETKTVNEALTFRNGTAERPNVLT